MSVYNRFVGLFLIVISFLALIGCQNNKDIEIMKNTKIGKLKIMCNDESDFLRDFGKLFKIEYPNIQLEFISLPRSDQGIEITDSTFNDIITQNKPDIILLDLHWFSELSKKGILTNLESKIQADKEMDFNRFAEPIISILRSQSNGGLDGLAPFFHSRVLYFNKDIFDKYNIPHPTNGLSWDRVFNTATTFSKLSTLEDQDYGLFHSFDSKNPNLLWLLNIAAESENLKLYDSNLQKNIFKGTRYEDFLKYIVQGIQDKSIYWPTEQGKYQDLFLMGKAAMRYEGYFYLRNIRNVDFNWGVVSDPTSLGDTSSYTLNDIFSIPKVSDNQELAWEFIKYINSDRFMRIKSHTDLQYGLSVSTNILNENADSTNNYFKPFYYLEPRNIQFSDQIDHSQPVINLDEIVNRAIKEVLIKKTSINDAIDLIDKQIQK